MGHSVGMDLHCASLAFIDGLGAPEMVLIFVLVLVLFGGQKLPEFARGLGKSIREFKKAAAGVEEEFKRALEEDERKNATPKLAAPVTDPTPVTDPASSTDSHYDHGGPGYDDHSTMAEDDAPAVQPEDAPVSPSTSTTPATQPTIMPPASNAPAADPKNLPAPNVLPPPPPSSAGSPTLISPPTPPAPPPPGNPS